MPTKRGSVYVRPWLTLKPDQVDLLVRMQGVAQAQLGHSHMATTLEVYTHASVIAQREAVNLLDKQVFPSVPKTLKEAAVQQRLLRQLIEFARLSGAPGQTRTGDPLLRRQTLYPTELRAHTM
jgi:hypothetical protein